MITRSIISCQSSSLHGTVTIPGDKSISHRSLILGAVSNGVTYITGLLESDDVLKTIKVLQSMGVIIYKKNHQWIICGVGNGCFLEPKKSLDFGNSGTGVRLIMGLVGTYNMKTVFIGDSSLSKRPMNRILDPLKMMGVQIIKTMPGNKLPIILHGPRTSAPITYQMPLASSQVKSAILFAALNTPGKTTVIEENITRDHTEKMLYDFGANIKIKTSNFGTRTISVIGQEKLQGQKISIPGDPSSAAFIIAAALLVPKSEIKICNVLLNPTRCGFLKTIKEMGANISLFNKRKNNGEIISDIYVCYSNLNGVIVPKIRVPSMIDEYPILSILASFSKGKTVMKGIQELRFKESDRISSIVLGLKNNGIRCEEGFDNIIIYGCSNRKDVGGGNVLTDFDHRIAMSFVVMGMVSEKSITIDDSTFISTSFPEFLSIMKNLGANLSW